jgi:hypothetical protein
METDVNQDMEDYWNEYKILQHTKLLDSSLVEGEDYGSRSCDGKFIIYINIYKFLIIYISKNLYHTSEVTAASLCVCVCVHVWHNGNLHGRKYYYWQD